MPRFWALKEDEKARNERASRDFIFKEDFVGLWWIVEEGGVVQEGESWRC